MTPDGHRCFDINARVEYGQMPLIRVRKGMWLLLDAFASQQPQYVCSLVKREPAQWGAADIHRRPTNCHKSKRILSLFQVVEYKHFASPLCDSAE